MAPQPWERGEPVDGSTASSQTSEKPAWERGEPVDAETYPSAPETRMQHIGYILSHPFTDIPIAKEFADAVRGEPRPTTEEPSFMKDVVLKTGREFAADMIPTSPTGIATTMAAGPVFRGVQKYGGRGLNKLISTFPEEKAAAATKETATKSAQDAHNVNVKAEVDTNLHTAALDKANALVQSKQVSKDAVDQAYEKVTKLGNPRVDAKPYEERLKALIGKQENLPPVWNAKKQAMVPHPEKDTALLKTLRHDLHVIQDNGGTMQVSELKALMENYGTKGYQSDTTKAGYYRAMHGGINETLENGALTGRGMTPDVVDAYKAARVLHKQRLGGTELKDILDKSTKESEKLGIPTLQRSGMIDRINRSEQMKQSFSEADRKGMIEELRNIQFPKKDAMPLPAVTAPTSSNAALRAVLGQVAGQGVGAGLEYAGAPKTGVATMGFTAAVGLLLATKGGRATIRATAKKLNGPLPPNVVIGLATAMTEGQATKEATSQ